MNCLEKYQYSKEHLATFRRHFNHVVDFYEKGGNLLMNKGNISAVLKKSIWIKNCELTFSGTTENVPII